MARHPLLHLPREVWREPHHPLQHHQLPAVVHFVLLGRHQHLEARLGRRLRSGRHLYRFRQEGVASPRR